MKQKDVSRIQTPEMKFLRSRTDRDRIRNEVIKETVKEERLQGEDRESKDT